MIKIDEATLLFIETHLNDDIQKLLLKKKQFPNTNMFFAIQQIEGKRKGIQKFPSLVKISGFIFPSELSMEQCSSELTAQFKADLLAGKNILDVTGGLGIDDYFISRKATAVTYIEENEELAHIAKHNFEILEATNIQAHTANGIEWLEKTSTTFDCIYIDPARRNNQKQKVVLLEDCSPNIIEHQTHFFKKADCILLKASPMLDISRAIDSLKTVLEVYIVAVKNECKELLFFCRQGNSKPIQYHCINILSQTEQQIFSFNEEEERSTHLSYAENLAEYVYEPNAAILKAGAFKIISKLFPVQKLAQHSHLYTSPELIPNFPGRIFKTEAVFSLNEKEINHFFPTKKASIVTRNFPMTANDIRKKFRINDEEGTHFLIATTLSNGKKVAIKCSRILNSVTC